MNLKAILISFALTASTFAAPSVLGSGGGSPILTSPTEDMCDEATPTNNSPTTTPTGSVQDASSDTCAGATPNFGSAANFNAVFFGDYQGSSDIEGKIAIQGNAIFSDGFSVGYKQNSSDCSNYGVVVGGSLEWNEGQNYAGSIAVGNSSDVCSCVMDKCKVETNQNAFDFATARQTLISLSSDLCSKADTGSFSLVSSTLSLSFKGNLDYEVVNVNQSDFFGGHCKDINAPTGMNPNATLVFNIPGSEATLRNMSMEALSSDKVIFNFCEAEMIDISYIAVRGAVLAPNADIPGSKGVVYGPVYAKTMSGSCQINLKPIQPSCPGSSSGSGSGSTVSADANAAVTASSETSAAEKNSFYLGFITFIALLLSQ